MKQAKIFLLMAMLAAATAAMAIPARPGVWQTIRTADGTEVRVELRGDEYAHYWQAADGRLFCEDGGTFVEVSQETIRQRQARRMLTANRRRAARRKTTIGGQHEPYLGQRRGLIILVEFGDQSFEEEHTPDLYNQIANERGFKSDLGFEGSIRDYFLEQSNGQFDLTFDVVGPVPLSNGYAHYGADDPATGEDGRPGEMVVEACRAIEDEVDFSRYDWDGDGEVEQVFIIYAGRGQNNGGGSDTVWPHEWSLSENDYGQTLSIQGMTIDTYACSAEMQRRGRIDGIGTACHEFSHCLGLPDMYDTAGSNYGMGFWDLMAHGSYNGMGFCPAGYTSYERMYAGWKQPIELSRNTTVSNMKALSEGGNSYIIYNDGHRNEYYLLENRQLTGWDQGLPGSGLLIVHVDFDERIWKNNAVNSTTHPFYNDHQRCTPISSYLAMYNEDGDSYPQHGNNSLTNYSQPYAMLYHRNSDGSYLMNKPITDITLNADGTVSFNFRNESAGRHEMREEEGINHAGALFYESFDRCNGSGGNDEKWKGNYVGQGSFRADNDGWQGDWLYGGSHCALFGRQGNNTMVTTPPFTLNGSAPLAFRCAPWEGESELLYVFQNGTNNISISPLRMFTGDWNIVRTTIEGEGETTLTFASTGRFFLDDVTVQDPSSTAIAEVDGTDGRGKQNVYRLDGTPCGTSVEKLPPGIYVRGGKKLVISERR